MEEKEKLLSAFDKLMNVTYQQTLLLMAFFGVVFFGDNIENAVKVINATTNKTGLPFAIAVFFAVFSMFAIFIAYWLYYCIECYKLKKKYTELSLDKETKARLIHFSFWVVVYVIAVVSLLTLFFRTLIATDEATGVFYAFLTYVAICTIGTLAFAGWFLKILPCSMKYILLGTIAVTVTGILCSQLNCCSTEPEQKKADTVSSACANSNSNKEALTHPPVTVTSDEKICDTVVLQLYLRPGNREYKICQSPIQQH